MKTKTIVGALIGIVIIILIVVLARGHKTVPASTAGTATTTTTPMDSQTTTTATGLQITTTQQGTGDGAVNGDKVTVNYTGMLTDGTVFDSNVDPKFQHVQPFTFTLGAGQVIAGWDQGVLGMKVGEKRHLVIPANLAYGSQGAGALIPPNSTLAFDVEVTAISK